MPLGMKSRGILVKRSNCLVFFFHDGALHCKNYLTGKEFEASPLLVPILDKLDRWRGYRGIERLLPEYSAASIRQSLRRLIANTAVLVRGSSQAKRESALSAWQVWGVEARYFHFSTKDTHSAPIRIDEA